jgi:hypothetical protein
MRFALSATQREILRFLARDSHGEATFYAPYPGFYGRWAGESNPSGATVMTNRDTWARLVRRGLLSSVNQDHEAPVLRLTPLGREAASARPTR